MLLRMLLLHMLLLNLPYNLRRYNLLTKLVLGGVWLELTLGLGLGMRIGLEAARKRGRRCRHCFRC